MLRDMKKIGVTSSGSVMVEMTHAQFDALTKVLAPVAPSIEPDQEESALVSQPVPAMAVRKRLDSVRKCLRKIRPSGRNELFRTVRLVCQPTGGVNNIQIEHMLQILEKEDFLKVEDDRIRYPWHEQTKGSGTVPKIVEPAAQEGSGI